MSTPRYRDRSPRRVSYDRFDDGRVAYAGGACFGPTSHCEFDSDTNWTATTTRSNEPTPSRRRPPLEVVIVPANESVRSYAAFVEKRLNDIGLQTLVEVVLGGSNFEEARNSWTNNGALFVIELEKSHQKCRSVTLSYNKKDDDPTGTAVLRPYRLKNMDLEDAVEKIKTTIDEVYMERFLTLQMPSRRIQSRDEMKQLYTPRHIAYLMHLLADFRYLTLEELTMVGNYVENRRQFLAKAEGKPLSQQANSIAAPAPMMQPSAPIVPTFIPTNEFSICSSQKQTSSASKEPSVGSSSDFWSQPPSLPADNTANGFSKNVPKPQFSASSAVSNFPRTFPPTPNTPNRPQSPSPSVPSFSTLSSYYD